MNATILHEAGTGRNFAVLLEADSPYRALTQAVFNTLSTTAKVFLIEFPQIEKHNWRECGDLLQQVLLDKKVRQLSLITVGAASILAHYTYLKNAKLIRSCLIIDGTTSAHPSGWEQFIDWLEMKFPLGLPLRGETGNFNSRAHLQRIRCPVLHILTKRSDELVRQQAEQSTAAMPTAWLMDIRSEIDSPEEYSEVVTGTEEFQTIPAKCPQ